ncbi:MAG: hypothetical protein LC126_27225 [Bryobacterales bacterium]|nr:hypothetical protein [Bryobacterales bacterium]
MIRRRDLWKILAACPAGATFLRAADRLEPAAVQTGDVAGGEATVWMRYGRAGMGYQSGRWRDHHF